MRRRLTGAAVAVEALRKRGVFSQQSGNSAAAWQTERNSLAW